MDSIKNYIREFINNIKKNPIAMRALIILGIFILIVIVLILFASCSRKRVYTYDELESKMVELARKKYSLESENLPINDGDEVTVSLQSFVDAGMLDNIQDIVENNSACSGSIKIKNNNGYYLFTPYLDCGSNYKSDTLYEKLISKDNVVNVGNGLYASSDGYIFKGDNVNNFIVLNDIKYRILKITNDGLIRVIDTTKRDNSNSKWDDRYNIDRDSSVGINNYITNNINSRVKDAIEEIYMDDDNFTNNTRSHFISTPVCVGKRSINDTLNDGSIECASTIESQPFSLIQANEFYNASLDSNCGKVVNTEVNLDSCLNYNYLTSIGTTWTVTADRDTTYKVFKMTSSGLMVSNASSSAVIRIVTHISDDLLVSSGNGSEKDPYIIKTFE